MKESIMSSTVYLNSKPSSTVQGKAHSFGSYYADAHYIRATKTVDTHARGDPKERLLVVIEHKNIEWREVRIINGEIKSSTEFKLRISVLKIQSNARCFCHI